MNAKRIEPTRRLTAATKPHKYVPAAHTNIRETFAKFERLQALQRAAQEKS